MAAAIFTLACLLFSLSLIQAQTDDIGLDQGFVSFTVGNFEGQLTKGSQNLVSLQSTKDSNFDFLPFSYLPQRAYNGAHHIGDVTIRYRSRGTQQWTSLDNAAQRQAVLSLNSSDSSIIAAADLSKSFGADTPLKITREWLSLGSKLGLRVNVTNTASFAVEIGSFGFPIEIGNIFINKTATEIEAIGSLADPYIGYDAGYVQVTPTKGSGSALVILPHGKAPLEAWRFLQEPAGNLGYQEQVYEGNYEWQTLSLAWAQNEWSKVNPWNVATSRMLEPSETYSAGLEFALANSVQTIEDTVVAAGVPLVQGVPGYIIPQDMTAELRINHTSPVVSLDVGGAFTVDMVADNLYNLTPTSSWGRARVTITYQDGRVQTVHYFITKSAPQAISDLGSFFFSKAYFNKSDDPFGRSPSIMTYDHDEGAIVEQEARAWVPGLSDEGGTGAYVASAMKQFVQPKADEMALLDDFLHKTVRGTIQQNNTFSVVASTFYYQPDAINYPYDTSIDWNTWTSFNKARAYTTVRAYNYIWPTAAYWAMYRAVRDYPEMQTQSDWIWYLLQAYNTIQYCFNDTDTCGYALVGLMGETVLYELLLDLGRENMTAEFNALEGNLRKRSDFWATLEVPFGSEMAWDSTGQEGVYLWSKYFGSRTKQEQTVQSILGYMPTIAHWGWNGNARRYWDFLYGGKIQRIERQIHHYGSGLNSLPMLSEYRSNPDPSLLNLLRRGFGGSFGALTNIHQDGFASSAFHSWPDTLEWDPISGDYGQNFLGMALGHATYVVREFSGQLTVYGGNVYDPNGGVLEVHPRDAVRKRVFIGPIGLAIEISGGIILSFTYDSSQNILTFQLAARASTQGSGSGPASAGSTVIWLTDSASSRPSSSYKVTGGTPNIRGGTLVPLSPESATTVTITQI